MPLVLPKIQKEMEAALITAFLREFAKEAASDPTSYQRQAKAIAEGVSQILVSALLNDAITVGPEGPGKIT